MTLKKMMENRLYLTCTRLIGLGYLVFRDVVKSHSGKSESKSYDSEIVKSKSIGRKSKSQNTGLESDSSSSPGFEYNSAQQFSKDTIS